ncbi:tetratricopeptide repeat protein [Streptomyces sp. NPDC058739]|uniref:tetratricopeptide repeat protein n=1 Tax=Streptomyces sp. NPDC058739 TaxID=3346618 RepID=UPI003686B46A
MGHIGELLMVGDSDVNQAGYLQGVERLNPDGWTPDGDSRSNVIRDLLRSLHEQAGRPSKGALKRHADLRGHDVGESTLIGVPSGSGNLRWATVAAFIDACAGYAESRRKPLRGEAVDLNVWRARFDEAHPGVRVTGRRAAPARELSWPVEIGVVPALASAFQKRQTLRARIDEEGGTAVLSGGGGVGKSQLAAARAHRAREAGVDLVMWVDASQPDNVAATFAQAAARIRAPGAEGSNVMTDAEALLTWLASTDRSWLIVLDDLSEPAMISRWWPPTARGGNGRVLVTTRRRDALLSGGGRTVVDIDVYDPEESNAYLTERLTQAGAAHVLDGETSLLATELGHLPLALSHAAAYMIDQQIRCGAYLTLFSDRRTHMDHVLPRTADTENYGRSVEVTLLLSLEAVRAREPGELAMPVVRLIAMLDAAGHPETVWSTPAVRSYLADPAFEETRATLLLLHRYALITYHVAAGPLAVRMHALTSRAVRENTPVGSRPGVTQTAAAALLAVWPTDDYTDPTTSEALRLNAIAVRRHADEDLWHDDGRELLFRIGNSLTDAGLHSAAVEHWRPLVDQADRILGSQHPDTLVFRGNLALSHSHAGHIQVAVTTFEALIRDANGILAGDDPALLAARNNLAFAYHKAGRHADAVTALEELSADLNRFGDSEQRLLLAVRNNLAGTYRQVGRTQDAITASEQVIPDFERILGPEHPDTLAAHGNLANSYIQAKRITDAVYRLERLAADTARIFGPEHSTTLTAVTDLAKVYCLAGRATEAITIVEEAIPLIEQTLGLEHPSALLARATFALAYSDVQRHGEAAALQETIVADAERILGREHPDTLAEWNNLATSYFRDGRLSDAIAIEERLVRDWVRISGPDHPDTLTTRGNLASSYFEAGRHDEAIVQFEQLVKDARRALGPTHPGTLQIVGALRYARFHARRS